MLIKNSKRFTQILVVTLAIFPALIQASDNEEQPVTYKNEKAIVFETMDGKTTDAFEGFIEVPENRANANSRLIPVNYVRFPATGKKKGSPIIYLSGGPGGSGIMTAKYPRFRYPLFMALREFGDVIALDQRGTGASKPALKCQSNQALPMTTVLTEPQIATLYQLAANECVNFWQKKGIDVHGYTTVESAKDIDALREHFNEEKVTLWGISYGSHLAFASLKVMAGKIDKVIVASAEGLNQTVKLPFETDAYFGRLQQAINTQPDSAKQYPDIKALIHRVHQQLVKQPMLVKIPQKDGSEQEFLFQKYHMQILASAMISDPRRGVVHLLGLYHQLDAGSDIALLQVLKRGYFNGDKISFDIMSLAMDVASGVTTSRLKQVTEQAKTSLLGTALNFPMPHLNKAIKGLDLGDEFRAYPKSDVPTLLLTGTLDGRTYVDSQTEATKGLSKLTQVKIVNAGHNLFMSSPKVTEVIKSFLNDEEVTTKEITVKLPSFIGSK